jgi:hypothetical protein
MPVIKTLRSPFESKDFTVDQKDFEDPFYFGAMPDGLIWFN